MPKPAKNMRTALRIVTGALLVSSCQPASSSRPQAPAAPWAEPAGSAGELTGQPNATGQVESASRPDVPLPMEPIPPPAQIDQVRVPERGCFPDARAPQVRNAGSDTAKHNEAAYQAELRRQGLATLSLGSENNQLHRGMRDHRNQTVAIPGNMIAGPRSWSGSATHPEPWEFVQTRSGSVYRVRRILQPARAKDVVLCGCMKKKCGPYGMGCPACGATTQTLYGPLPAGATFKGELMVRFNGETVRVSHEQGPCKPQRRCPAPPPSMPRGR